MTRALPVTLARRSRAGVYQRAVALLVIGLGLVVGSACWAVVTGLRVDATGSVVSTAEQVGIWGGLTAGGVVIGVALVLSLRSDRTRS